MTFTHRLQYEPPIPGKKGTLEQIANFVDQARALGARPDTPVEAVALPQDPEQLQIDYLEITFDGLVPPLALGNVSLPMNDIRALRDFFAEMARGDGDVREVHDLIGTVHRHLVELADDGAITGPLFPTP